MTLDELNRKYEGRPLDMKKWRFSGMSQVGGLALAANDVELDDGNFYDFNAVIEMGGNAKPSDIALHGNCGCFGKLRKYSVRRNGESEAISEPDGRFVDAIDTMIAPAFGLIPSTKVKAVVLVNDVCPWDYPTSEEATREECDAAWEKIKRELVHYTACKYNLPEPEDLSEDPDDYPFQAPRLANFDTHYELTNLLAYRMRFEIYFCGKGRRNPSWERSSAWVKLRNAMLDEMFDRVGIDLPPEAHSLPYMFNGRKRDTWERLLPKKQASI